MRAAPIGVFHRRRNVENGNVDQLSTPNRLRTNRGLGDMSWHSYLSPMKNALGCATVGQGPFLAFFIGQLFDIRPRMQ